MLLTVQPWGLGSVSGGSRVIKVLLADAPIPVHSICTAPEPPKPSTQIPETHVPNRPFLGKLDYSRFAGLGNALDKPFRNSSRRKLSKVYGELGATVVHIVAHGYAFSAAYFAAKDLGLPVVLTVHDDLRYTMRGSAELQQSLEWLGEIWRGADSRMVISDEMGAEYCKRYGEMPFTVVTNGIEALSPPATQSQAGGQRVLHFMGLLHQGYLPSVKAAISGVKALCDRGEDWHMVTRCGTLSFPFEDELMTHVTMHPFGSEKDLVGDMERATVLYQPLSFGSEYDDFNRFSLSAKMVTYLGSGKPILFHGPADSAAGQLLVKWSAAEIADSLDPEEVANALERCVANSPELVQNARRLAESRFMLVDQRRLFWKSVSEAIGQELTLRT